MRWLFYIVISLLWGSLIVHALFNRQYRRCWWWLGWWLLTTLTWTPVTLNFGSAVGGITTHWWAGGIWVIRPLQPASVDTFFWLNIVMTVPQGGLLAWNWPRLRWPQWVLAGIFTGLTLEAGQALGNWLLGLGRWVDVNDVLTNATGIVIGAILFWCWRQWQQKKKGRGSKCL